MVVQVDNPSNKSMHTGGCCIGLQLDVPPKVTLLPTFTPTKTNKQFQELQQDVYTSINNAKPKENLKFPTILKFIICAMGLGILYVARKDILTSLVSLKNLILRK